MAGFSGEKLIENETRNYIKLHPQIVPDFSIAL